jgi:hypothetical protein
LVYGLLLINAGRRKEIRQLGRRAFRRQSIQGLGAGLVHVLKNAGRRYGIKSRHAGASAFCDNNPILKQCCLLFRPAPNRHKMGECSKKHGIAGHGRRGMAAFAQIAFT